MYVNQQKQNFWEKSGVFFVWKSTEKPLCGWATVQKFSLIYYVIKRKQASLRHSLTCNKWMFSVILYRLRGAAVWGRLILFYFVTFWVMIIIWECWFSGFYEQAQKGKNRWMASSEMSCLLITYVKTFTGNDTSIMLFFWCIYAFISCQLSFTFTVLVSFLFLCCRPSITAQLGAGKSDCTQLLHILWMWSQYPDSTDVRSGFQTWKFLSNFFNNFFQIIWVSCWLIIFKQW